MWGLLVIVEAVLSCAVGEARGQGGFRFLGQKTKALQLQTECWLESKQYTD